MNRIVFHFSFVVLFIFFSFFQIAKSADVPEILNYQGTLTDNTGQPITGTKEITFNLYDVASGGTASWSETQTVTLIDGKFSVVLGSTNPLNANLFTGETFLGIQVESGAEMAPRQKMTSVAYALKSLDVVNLPDSIPSGVIVMWHGSVDAIPEGWALCDGNNGTPNLTDQFVVGAGNTYSPHDTGGEKEHTLTVQEMPAHNHGVGDPGHAHNITFDSDGGNDPVGGNYSFCTDYRDSKGTHTSAHMSAISHTTGISIQNAGSGNAHNNLPPYYALCYIMKL